MRPSSTVLAVSLAVCLSASAAGAQQKLEVQGGDSVKSVLERHVGKRVGVVLHTGQELTGVVTTVGEKVVHLSELSGREFFDAVVSLDRVGAVVIRTRTR